MRSIPQVLGEAPSKPAGHDLCSDYILMGKKQYPPLPLIASLVFQESLGLESWSIDPQEAQILKYSQTALP
jgi:hypothetical protein